MNLEDIKKSLLTNDDFVLLETKKLQILYQLKQEIRYAKTREVRDTESVAEHVFGMLNLIEYFLPLENPLSTWDKSRVQSMTLIHDIDEIETGDTIGYLKTEQDRIEEYNASEKVVGQLPYSLHTDFLKLIKEYNEQITPESTFVKAIDRIEPLFHLYNQTGKAILHDLQTTFEQNASIKEDYVKPFPFIKRFYQVISYTMLKEGFFVD